MGVSRRLVYLFAISCVLWLGAMGGLYYAHYVRDVDEELGYFSADIRFDNERRQYFGVFLDGRKIGYKSDSQFDQRDLKVLREDGTIKLNLAGESREVFIQTTAGIDSATLITRYMDLTLSSGEHVNNFNAFVKQDSLIILVKNNPLAEWRKGVFIVDGIITLPCALPFYLHNATVDSLSLQIFDPVTFALTTVEALRSGGEVLTIGNIRYDTVRFDLHFGGMNSQASTMWLDQHGTVVKSEGFPFFGTVFGHFVIEKAMEKNVFLLPIEVPYGNDVLKKLALRPDTPIRSPREVSYLEVELIGMRAANIDITISNKEIVSLNPVVFVIHDRPLADRKRLADELKLVASDTSLVGMSDYIQPYDSRIIRTAGGIVSGVSDTLAMAHALNQWVFAQVVKTPGLDIIRSVDILRNLKGDCDEHTKLFTALARSLGIPTQITMGLVYRDSAFRYHSWPSVFVGGVWHDLDPFFGQDYADATHIALIRGDFDKLVELFRFMNFITVRVLDYR